MLSINILILLSVIDVFSFNPEQTQSIKFEYVGETIKPIPSILFYNSDSVDSILLSKEENSINVSQNEFELIKKIVAAKIIQDSTSSINFYQFTIRSKNKNATFLTAEKAEVSQIFTEIINCLSENEKRNNVQTFWNDLSRRL